MRRIAIALIAAFTVLAVGAPAQGKVAGPQAKTYRLTAGEGLVRLHFRGDEAAGCRERGTCGISGTTTYAFGGKPEYGEVFWLKSRKRTVAFFGSIETSGETLSDVVTAGSDTHCVDRVNKPRFEYLAFEPRSQRVRFTWRKFTEDGVPAPGLFIGPNGGDNPFDTRCAGPELEDVAAAVPYADVPYRVFRSPRSSFSTAGTRAFAGGGFAGTVEWDLSYSLRFRPQRRR